MPVYALTIFTGAFLLFLVQPLIGKYILPWFGGAPAVWTTCMLFFQMLLLGGYAYAHISARWLKPRAQAILHLALLAAALALLPITAKESVRRRLEDREQGISYTEFSYMLLQANDFLQLFDSYGCTIQAGGSDQWGNITAGIDLVRKARSGAEVYGFTHPLLATASGEKFGKSAGNAVWLDARRTSPYQFYQFWVQSEDADVERYLKLFTFETIESIDAVIAAHREHPERRDAQKLLATRMTESVHGKEGLDEATRASEALFGKELSGLSDEELSSIFADVPSKTLERTALLSGLRLSQALVAAGACASKSEATRLIQGGGVYLNNRRMSADGPVTESDLASKSMLVLRTGKKSYYLLRFA